MSNEAMIVPTGHEDFGYAELFILLPVDPPFKIGTQVDAESIMCHAWIIDEMRKVGSYPHANKTWLGGPITVIKTEEPLGPNC